MVSPSSKENPEVVVIGYCTYCSTATLTRACEAVAQGAAFVCTERDASYCWHGNTLPGTGWVVSAVECATGVSPSVIGKPNDYSLKLLLDRLGLRPCDVVLRGG